MLLSPEFMSPQLRATATHTEAGCPILDPLNGYLGEPSNPRTQPTRSRSSRSPPTQIFLEAIEVIGATNLFENGSRARMSSNFLDIGSLRGTQSHEEMHNEGAPRGTHKDGAALQHRLRGWVLS